MGFFAEARAAAYLVRMNGWLVSLDIFEGIPAWNTGNNFSLVIPFFKGMKNRLQQE